MADLISQNQVQPASDPGADVDMDDYNFDDWLSMEDAVSSPQNYPLAGQIRAQNS